MNNWALVPLVLLCLLSFKGIRRWVCSLCVIFVAVIQLARAADEDIRRPNIVFILADDLASCTIINLCSFMPLLY